MFTGIYDTYHMYDIRACLLLIRYRSSSSTYQWYIHKYTLLCSVGNPLFAEEWSFFSSFFSLLGNYVLCTHVAEDVTHSPLYYYSYDTNCCKQLRAGVCTYQHSRSSSSPTLDEDQEERRFENRPNGRHSSSCCMYIMMGYRSTACTYSSI